MSRNKVVVGGAVAIAVVAVVILIWSSAGSLQASGSPAATESAGSYSQTVPATPSQWPTPTPGATDGVDPGEPIQVDIDQSALVAGTLTARISEVTSFEAEDSEEPGQLAGPAVSVTIEVTNASGKAVDLAGASLNLDFGDAHTPAPAIGDPVATGLPATVADGATVTGTYSFSLPLDVREQVRVILDLVSGESQVIFLGKLASD
ncbi:hypothetical protein [Microbacterium sp.]|uniref:hypothetical protein n=1 Tax=Microbacterium sp. TaxID=51671 RepID=UPI0039E623C2